MNGKRNGKKVIKPNGLTARLIAKLTRPVARRFSDIVCESLKQPGSWRCLEIVYQNKPRTLLDHFFLSSSASRGTRNRLRILQEEIRRCIEQYSRIHNPVMLISFGSGPGHEIIDCIERFKGRIAIEATCVDKDLTALEYGKVLAIQRRISDAIHYVQGNVLHAGQTATAQHIGIVSGLLDYFSFESATSVMKKVKEQLLPGGTVLIANMRRHYLASTMSVLGNWPLVYREPEEVEAILRESGYEDIEVWLEPEKVFCIGKGTKPT